MSNTSSSSTSPRTPGGKHKLGPKDFKFGELLGEGSYARVYQATSLVDGKCYAAKIMDKHHVKKNKKIRAVMQERDILSSCNHPSIVHLHLTFQDAHSVYFMLEVVPGGELFELIQRMGTLPLRVAQFFTAEIVNVLEYLHQKQGIVHRDLKPENLLLTRDRHLKLTDFGTAGRLSKKPPKISKKRSKNIRSITRSSDDDGEFDGNDDNNSSSSSSSRKHQEGKIKRETHNDEEGDNLRGVGGKIHHQMKKRYDSTSSSSGRKSGGRGSVASSVVDTRSEDDSCVGTAEYVSPEVLDGKEQTPACDFWSLGCIIYHMLVGRPPFKGASEYLTIQQVMQAAPEYPEDLDPTAKDLIKKLLVVDASKRPSVSEIKAHSFFATSSSSIDWENLPTTPAPTWNEPKIKDLIMSTKNVKIATAGGVGVTAAPPRSRSTSRSSSGNNNDGGAEGKEEGEKQQAARSWSQFLIHGEKVVFTGLIQKRSFSGVSLFSKRRQLILTSFPRILYVDPNAMKLRGEIPWADNIVAEHKNRKNFVLHTKGKQYHICCLSHEAQAWVKAIKRLKQEVAASSR